MIVSDEHRFVFIAVPKTASVSIESVLREHGRWINKNAVRGGRHTPAAKAKKLIVPDWDSYFSFAVVRHPVDWLHSWYKFWSAPGKHNKLSDVSFVDFVSRTLAGGDKNWKDVGTVAQRVCSQTGEILVSRLLCFDHLAVQFPRLQANLGIPVSELPQKNISNVRQLHAQGRAPSDPATSTQARVPERTMPKLPEDLMAEVRRVHHRDFLLYARAYHDFADECAAAGEAARPPKFDVLPKDRLTELRYASGQPQAPRKTVNGAGAPAVTKLPDQSTRANSSPRNPLAGFDDIKSAIEAARLEVKQSPEGAKSHFRLGKLLFKAGELDSAAESVRRAMALKPASVKNYRLLSTILLQQGDIDQAVALSREALSRKPDSPELLKHLAKTLRRQGQKDEAAPVPNRSAMR